MTPERDTAADRRARAEAAVARMPPSKPSAPTSGARAKAAAVRALAPKVGALTLGSELKERITALEGLVVVQGRNLALLVATVTGYRCDIEALKHDLAAAVWQKGEKGEQGPAGPPGASVVGPAGPQGPRGPDGARGPTGESVVGPTGPQGPFGPQGVAGPAGKDGAPGKDGAAGPQGVPGGAGPRGERGLAGPRGLGPVAQPESARAKEPPVASTALPGIVGCPECGERLDLEAELGADFGRFPSVTSACHACHCSFDVDAKGVYPRCRKCGHRLTQEHICG